MPYLKNGSFELETLSALSHFIQGLVYNMKRIYNGLPVVEKDKVMKLSGEEKETMLFLLKNPEEVCKK